MEKKPPERHNELHDPKLPIVNGQTACNRAQNHICPSPINATLPPIER